MHIEVSRLKADFEQLCTEGKITSESKVVMSSLFMIVELIHMSRLPVNRQ